MNTETKKTTIISAGALALAFALGGCDGGDAQKDTVARAMQQSLQVRLTTLYQSAQLLQAAAPTPAGRGWDKDLDAQALTDMKAAWMQARDAYEHVEGATAPIYPDIDVAIDERYDGFLADLKGNGDQDLFDDQEVTGMHAIERILYADVTPAGVVEFEKTLPGYKAAAWPKTAEEAAAFKDKLCARLVTDTKLLLDGWTPAKVDISGAFQGLIGLVNEQQEKVNKAATNEEESRYSQRTMADLRANLDGTKAIYALFRDWLKTKAAAGTTPSGTDVDAAITTGLADLDTVYGGVQGDAIPPPPTTWSAEMPSATDLQTPFGQLYSKIRDEVSPAKSGSLVNNMNDGANLLGIPGFTEE
jgi:iron uptake system component EfeO